jgi:hypothetical protein
VGEVSRKLGVTEQTYLISTIFLPGVAPSRVGYAIKNSGDGGKMVKK